MVELALVVVEAEQQRPDFLLLLGIAEAADDAVGGALLLDLDHRPLAGAVFLIGPLGDRRRRARRRCARASCERGVAVAGHRRKMQARRRGSCGRSARAPRGARDSGSADSDLPSTSSRSNAISSAGRLRRELADAAFRRMQAQLERIEREGIADRDDQFAVEQELRCLERRAAFRRLRGNSAPSGLPDLDVSVTSSPSRRARQRKPSHLGSILPAVALRQFGGEQRLHRRGYGRVAGHWQTIADACSRSRCAAPSSCYAAGPILGRNWAWHSIRTQRPRAISTASVRPHCRRRMTIPSARNGCCCGRCSSRRWSRG